ncbi:MAG TPA: hypothetical protein VGN06_12585 [Gaiellaceae bacterium]|jgi:photosystem II stability/assembly factor-like uncharacterized protein
MRTVVAGVLVSLALVATAGAANDYTYPRFQPVSIAFVDEAHGALAEDDWVCQKAHGCQGRILVTSDGGSSWRVTYVGARGIQLYPVRGTRVIYALTGSTMIVSVDGGLHWRRAGLPQAVVSFVSPLIGWRIGPQRLLAHPPALEETRDGGRSWTRRVNPCRNDFGLTTAISFASVDRGWIVCQTQATSGYQGKEVWQTENGGAHWKLEARTHPIAPPEPKLQVGNIPGYGYPTGITFLPDGHGWLMQGRGYMLISRDGGHTWRDAAITKPDTIAAQSADLLDDNLGYVVLRGCTVQLDRTTDGARSWTTVRVWKSPTEC